MAPNLLGGTSALFLAEATSAEPVQIISTTKGTITHPLPQTRPVTKSEQPQYRWQIVWKNVIAFLYLHTFAFYGLYLFLFVCSWKTFFWTYLVILMTGQGITAGAHRLWAHRTYKAKLPLRILLAIFQTMAFQNHIYEWVRDHRVHHKFTDTDADPHNAKRGFFFSHMGWLMVKKHRDVKIKGKTVDLSDLEADPVVRFQRKYYPVLMPIACFFLPAVVPWYFWGEDWWVSWYTAIILRYTLTLNGTWLVNSAAHMYGTKPYDKNIASTENKSVSALAFGEGWHNYHHVFPWDYKAAELGNYRLNFTTAFIDFMAWIGWAYELKTTNIDMIKKRVARTGDGTRKFDDGDMTPKEDEHVSHGGDIWGWGDASMKEEDMKIVKIYNKID